MKGSSKEVVFDLHLKIFFCSQEKSELSGARIEVDSSVTFLYYANNAENDGGLGLELH